MYILDEWVHRGGSDKAYIIHILVNVTSEVEKKRKIHNSIKAEK